MNVSEQNSDRYLGGGAVEDDLVDPEDRLLQQIEIGTTRFDELEDLTFHTNQKRTLAKLGVLACGGTVSLLVVFLLYNRVYQSHDPIIYLDGYNFDRFFPPGIVLMLFILYQAISAELYLARQSYRLLRAKTRLAGALEDANFVILNLKKASPSVRN